MTTQLNAHAVILAGGIGTRFWPASTPRRPKQLLPLAGPHPLIEETLRRATELLGAGRVRVVTSPVLADAFEAMGALGEVGVMREPRARGTGPALAWAARELEREDPGCTMISMHADHRIEPPAGLRDTLVRAVGLAAGGRLVCLGVRPDRPETGYGYVALGDPLGDGGYEVERFVEKPAEETAAAYLAGGRHLWNTGIFIWRCADLLAALREFAPEIPLETLESGGPAVFFDACDTIAIDVAVMERAANVATVEARFEWDDVGVWDALARTRETDARGNAIVGRARMLDAADNIVWTESVRANLIGVSDLVVVEANGELLVMPRSRAARLKEDRAALDAGPVDGRTPGDRDG